MPQFIRVPASALSGLLLAAAVSGCEFMPDAAFDNLKSNLALRLAEAARGDAPDTIRVALALRNIGSVPATACLGPVRNVSYKTQSGNGSTGFFVDHPGCTREFTIAPGGVFQWRETVEAPRIPSAPVEVALQLQIVNPRRCGNWGSCAELELTSNALAIE